MLRREGFGSLVSSPLLQGRPSAAGAPAAGVAREVWEPMSRQRATRGAVAMGVMALCLGAPAVAAAQNGIKVGEGRLHPYLEVEGRYDSNVLLSPGGAQSGDVVLHVRPGITFDAAGSMLVVGLDASLDWAKYLGVSSQSTNLSQLFADATLKLGVNRGGQVGLELSDAFHRTDLTPSFSVGHVVTNYNDLKLDVPLRPGGGALELGVNGEWIMESFEPFVGGTMPNLGYNQVSGGASGRWRFLPRTAAVLEASYFAREPNDTSVSAEVKGLRALAGLAGLVTTRLAATLKAGYGDTFGSAGPDYRTWLANAELQYLGDGAIGLKVGYVHDYSADPGRAYSIYGIHRVYLDGKMLLEGRLAVTGQVEFDDVEYDEDLARALGLPPVSAQVVRLSPGLEYQVVRWVSVGVGYALTYRTSNQPALATFNYTKNETWLKLRVTY